MENYDIIFFKPEKFEDSMKCIDYIKQDKIVHVNLFGLEADVQQRILDFLSGAIFIQEGHIIKPGEQVFCTIPKTIKHLISYPTKEKISAFSTQNEEEEIIPSYSYNSIQE